MAETVQDIYSLISKPYSLLILAFTLDLCIGDPRWLPHPVRGIGWVIAKIEVFLRYSIKGIGHRIQHGEKIEKIAGVFLVVIVACLTYSLFYIVSSLLSTSHSSLPASYISFLLMVYLVSTTLCTKELIGAANSVIAALKNRDIKVAKENLHHIVGRDTESLDEKGILKATIESLSENASDGIIAPLFYFAIGGLPLAMTYKAINTMDSMIGYKNDRYRHFGSAAARLDDIANYIPARITGIIIAISSAIVFRSPFKVYRSMQILLSDGRKHPSPNSGVPEAAMAGALGIRLGGPSTYGGMVVDKPYIGKDESIVRGQEEIVDVTDNAVSIVRFTSVFGLGLATVFQYMRIMI